MNSDLECYTTDREILAAKTELARRFATQVQTLLVTNQITRLITV
jgi:hypothetical protein